MTSRQARRAAENELFFITVVDYGLAGRWKKTAVTPDATPINKPPINVPTRLPTPPTMHRDELGTSG